MHNICSSHTLAIWRWATAKHRHHAAWPWCCVRPKVPPARVPQPQAWNQRRMQGRKMRKRSTEEGGGSFPEEEEAKGNEGKKHKRAGEPCRDSETRDSRVARRWWWRLPETGGIVLEKPEQQLSQRCLVSWIVGWDIFGSFWNHVNVKKGIKALLKIKGWQMWAFVGF